MLYAYNEFAEAHIAQLTPQKEYYTNEKPDNSCMNIAEEFMQQFPYENIGFVSDDSNLINGQPEMKFNVSEGFENNIAA